MSTNHCTGVMLVGGTSTKPFKVDWEMNFYCLEKRGKGKRAKYGMENDF